MKRVSLLPLLLAGLAAAQVVPDALIRSILSEVSSETAFEHTRALAARTRYPVSESFFEAAGYVAAQARALGLDNVRIERFPVKQEFWDPVEGTLDLVEPEVRRLASFDDTAVLVAAGSKDGDLTADLVDVGEGTEPADYAGKEVKGKILLANGHPDDVWKAMGRRGAAGMLSGLTGVFFGRRPSPDAVMWGSAPPSALAMMISPRQAGELRDWLRRGPAKVRIRVTAKRSAKGEIGMVMGEIPGTVKDQDIVLTAHLDHQKPGANDNASGSGTLLEALATLKRLAAAGKIPAPRRTLRFWWSTEIRSEQEYFQKHPEEAGKILLAVNLDQAGGDRDAENNFVLIAGPDWLPSYSDDLIHGLAEHMRDAYAPPEHEPSPLFVAPRGSRRSFRPVYWDYAPLSDHIAFEARQVGIACISMAVPSLHVIHTDQDSIDRIDPTWLKRSALMVLAPALFAATAGPPNKDAEALRDYVYRRASERIAGSEHPKAQLALEEKRLDSVRAFDPGLQTGEQKRRLRALAEARER